MRANEIGAHGAAVDEARDRTMARSMWRGAIQFGLVTIPVRLYLATDSKESRSTCSMRAV